MSELSLYLVPVARLLNAVDTQTTITFQDSQADLVSEAIPSGTQVSIIFELHS
jgi:hypothetical protein